MRALPIDIGLIHFVGIGGIGIQFYSRHKSPIAFFEFPPCHPRRATHF